jgi:hypothetical protein|tara:strand:- start:33 stop:218 length:186 start_codon:yes stop_codon:yes gene_type:complete
MELEEKVRRLKERIALLNAKVRPSNDDRSVQTEAEISRQKYQGHGGSERLRQSIAEAKKKN